MSTTEIDNTLTDPRERATLVTGDSATFRQITAKIARIAETPHPPRAWYIAFTISLTLLAILAIMIAYLFFTGVGVWGMNRPNMWAFDITNFVFWVGIAHAGTLISAILFLFRQKWRTGINRFAEAMTIFAVVCAGMFPAIHVGRVWFVYWLFPLPNQMATWPNFFSPLLWDFFAVSTYATVSILFWYMGMVPDLATFRDRAKTKLRFYIYGILALGWRGSQRHWHVYEKAYLLLAALATPLVLSVHSVVSFDFAAAQVPGWHSTIFPPYFVAGAIFSGFAMVITLAVPARHLFGLKDFITPRHLDNMAKITLATSFMVTYSYLVEFFTAYYSANPFDRFHFLNRLFGNMRWAGWIMILCNVIIPQLFWFKRCRKNPWTLITIAILINVGMWTERFVIIVTSLSRDFLPSSWHTYLPSYVEVLTLTGSFGLFFTLFLLFCRYLPMVAIAEVKTVANDENNAPPERFEHLNIQISNLLRISNFEFRHSLHGYLAQYETPTEIRHAAKIIQNAGFKRWDCLTPFPVPGLEKAMAIKKTILPWLVLLAGVTGATIACLMQWYVNSPHAESASLYILSSYPLIISGKPYWSLPANIPIIFELTILFAALATFAGAWLLSSLPKLYHPLFNVARFRQVTDDKFFILLEAADPKFDIHDSQVLLASTHPTAIEEVRNPV